MMHSNSRLVVCLACGHTNDAKLPGLSSLGHEQVRKRATTMTIRTFDLVVVGNQPAATNTAQAITDPLIPANKFHLISNLTPAWPEQEKLQDQLADWVWARIVMVIIERGAKNTLVVGSKELMRAMALSCYSGGKCCTFRGNLQLFPLTHAEGYILDLNRTTVVSGTRLPELTA